MKTALFTALAVLSLGVSASAQTDVDRRRDLIVKSMNTNPSQWIAPIAPENAKVRDVHGRIDANPKAKFSYYMQAESEKFGTGKVTLIPMATSRFTPTYYQTDEWWDANKAAIDLAKKDGRPMPRQDMDEVQKWLTEMKLSTNPNVFEIDERTGSSKEIPLADFLREHIVDDFAIKGKLTLYRGAEKAGELDAWIAGQKPKGVRYWTPTALYAWRYARKNTNLVKELLLGKTPVMAYEISVEDFRSMSQGRWPKFTLGTEVTAKAHGTFDGQGLFRDHLANTEYLGSGALGTEIEIRSNRAGADEMVSRFKRQVGPAELAQEFEKNFEAALARIVARSPGSRATVEPQIRRRIEAVRLEAQVLEGINAGLPREELVKLASQVRSLGPQITNVDGFDLLSFVQNENLAPYRREIVGGRCGGVF